MVDSCPNKTIRNSLQNAAMAGAFLVMYGCQTASDSAGARPQTHSLVLGSGSSTSNSGEPVATVVDARPAAMVNGETVTWGDLRPAMSELAGAVALQELVLDRRVAEAVKNAGMLITTDDIIVERKTLLESLSNDPNTAIRLLEQLRARQKLGDNRFENLMRRNASLRTLVRDRVTITEQAIQSMHDLIHGPKRQGRIIVTTDLKTAQTVADRMKAGEDFAQVAIEMSVDSSAARGGLLEPISRADPAYPQALRDALWRLNQGETSDPVLVDNGYAILTLTRRLDGDGSDLTADRAALERLVRLSQERMLMDQLARQLLRDTQVTVFDHGLHEQWENEKRAAP